MNQPLQLVDTYSGRIYHNREGEWVLDAAAAEPADGNSSAIFIFAVVMAVVLFVVVMGFVIYYTRKRVARSQRRGPFDPAEAATA